MSVIKMPIGKKVKYAMRILDCMEVLTIDGTYDENPDYEDTITYMRFQNIISKKKEQMLRILNEDDPCECHNECRQILENKLVELLVS